MVQSLCIVDIPLSVMNGHSAHSMMLVMALMLREKSYWLSP